MNVSYVKLTSIIRKIINQWAEPSGAKAKLAIYLLYLSYRCVDLRKMFRGNRVISGGDGSPSGDAVREIRDNVDAPKPAFKTVVYTSADLQLSSSHRLSIGRDSSISSVSR